MINPTVVNLVVELEVILKSIKFSSLDQTSGLAEEKSSKRYSARTRPEHWNSRQSPSPSSVNNDQNYNDRAQLPDDQVQDALGTF